MSDGRPDISDHHDDFPSTSDLDLYKCYSEENWLPVKRQPLQYSTSDTTTRQKCRTESCTALRRSESRQSLLKRALSTQFLSSLWEPKLDKDLCRRIKLRYKDTAKYIIWPECPLPKTFIAVEKLNKKSNSKWITHKHPGNHNLTVSGNHWENIEKTNSYYRNSTPKRPTEQVNRGIEAEQPLLSVKTITKTTVDEQFSQLSEELIPEQMLINKTRRSESGDDEESIMDITTSELDIELQSL
uniref:THAP-type domain-containing protein n=1 Tax=Syphacia muris TaxID=451379 RepID=A0A0N5AAH3_9BILA